MGPPPSAGAKLQPLGSDVNDFFPHGVTINVGDKVRFIPLGFHDVFLPKGKSKTPLPLFVPDGKKVTGVNDAAGVPFFFNGLDEIGFNPALFASLFGKTVSYNGSKAVGSGLPLQDKPKPLSVRFTKSGKYTYYCDVHPGMTGTVRVKKHGQSVPSKKSDAKRVAKQVADAVAVAKTLAADKPPANTVNVGNAGKHGVSFFGFQPSKLTVPAGTTVLFRMKSGDLEAHTATTGPGSPDVATSVIGQIAASFDGPAPSPLAIYPSDPPPATAALSPALHGNGFWNSGVLDADRKSPQPVRNAVKFASAGTYEFYCMIHPFMHGTVVVQ